MSQRGVIENVENVDKFAIFIYAIKRITLPQSNKSLLEAKHIQIYIIFVYLLEKDTRKPERLAFPPEPRMKGALLEKDTLRPGMPLVAPTPPPPCL